MFLNTTRTGSHLVILYHQVAEASRGKYHLVRRQRVFRRILEYSEMLVHQQS